MSRLVRLNVGGTIFLTRHSTLAHSNSFFSALLSSTEPEDEYFVDRDPAHFRHILNFMRGAVTFPRTSVELDELLQEADFFSLPKLVLQVRRHREICRQTSTEHQLSIIAAKLA